MMNRLRCFLVLVYCFQTVSCTDVLAQQINAQSRGEVFFETRIGAYGENYVARVLTLPKPDGNIFIAGVSTRTSPIPSAKFLIWEITQAGEKVRELAFKKTEAEKAQQDRREPADTQEEDKVSDGDPRVIVSLMAAEDGGFIVVGNFGAETPRFVKLDRDGKPVLWKEIKTRFESVFIRKVFTATGGDFLLLGQALTDQRHEPVVMKLDAKGDKRWERIFEIKESNYASFTSGFSTDDGGLLLVGTTGPAEHLEAGPKEVFVVKCDGNANVQSEKRFAGRAPEACQIGRDKFAIIYDKGTSQQSSFAAKLIGSRLQELWERELIQGNFFMQPLKPASIPGGGFVVAGFVFDEASLKINQYDENGERLQEITVPPLVLGPLQVDPVCSESVAFIAVGYAEPVPPLYREIKLLAVPIKRHKSRGSTP
jgi:hypothetical protein